jgi:hypothetical protein
MTYGLQKVYKAVQIRCVGRGSTPAYSCTVSKSVKSTTL